MSEAMHPNMSVLKELDIQNRHACASIFANNFIWHHFNPKLPELESDHYGIDVHHYVVPARFVRNLKGVGVMHSMDLYFPPLTPKVLPREIVKSDQFALELTVADRSQSCLKQNEGMESRVLMMYKMIAHRLPRKD